MTEITDDSTVRELKAYLRDNMQKGVECFGCDQHVQLYSNRLNGAMVRSLIELYKLDKDNPNGEGDYFHVSEFEAWRKGYGGGQFAKVKYWGLAVDKDNTDEDKRTSGMWAITQKGRSFVESEVYVPSHVRIFNSKNYGFEGERVNIKNVLGVKFSYKEVMGEFYRSAPEQGQMFE